MLGLAQEKERRGELNFKEKKGWARLAEAQKKRIDLQGVLLGSGSKERTQAWAGPVYGGCEPGRQAEGERQVVEQAAPLGEER